MRTGEPLNKPPPIDLTPDEATLVAYWMTRALDTVTDPKRREQIRKVIAKVKTK